MGLPRFLAENHFNGVRNTDHTLFANEESTGNEVFHVGDGRRKHSYWTPTTDNSSAWVKVDAGSGNTISADMIAIDRESNLEGETVTLETSPDDTTWTQVFQATLPTTVATDGDVSAANGVLTSERAWLKTFTSADDRYWRLTVSAMGAGLKPEISGLWLGTSFQPNFYMDHPFTWGRRTLTARQTETAYGWRGTTSPGSRREMEIGLKFKTKSEYDTARYHFEDLYLKGDPMWVVIDEKKAERSWLSKFSPGTSGFEVNDNWGFPQGRIPATEHQPELP